MSPIEYIEKGICQGSWETVCEGYERLTGKSLPLPKTAKITNAEEALQQIADIASSILNEPIAEICNSPPKPAKRKPGRPVGGGNKKATKRKAAVTKNEEDSSVQIDENKRTIVQKEAGNAQLITNVPDPEEVKRNKARAEKATKNKIKLGRKAARKYKVKCNECEKVFESDREGGEMGQKCDSCLRKRKAGSLNGR